MNYKVLYRKYRPDNFENIIGQDYIIKTLQNSIKNGNISHAYIFSGPRGTGKTSTAKVFSKAINCLNPVNGSPCGECEFCKNFSENPDIIEIDAASNNGVDEIRNLIDNIKLTPTNGKYKVYIIDEVHMLTPNAFNALLLTLEEPPKHSIFILATTNIENVPITILSRCQRFDFQKIKIDDLVERLKYVCENEKISIENAALQEIAELSEGGMRDALSLLDQLSKNGEKITADLIEKQIKTVSQKNINDLLDSLENNNIDNCLNLINEYRNRAIDYKTLIKKLITIASKRAKNIKITGKYIRLNFKEYKDFIFDLSASLSRTNINVDNFTLLELIFLDYLESNQEETIVKKSAKEPEKIDEEIVEKEKVNQNTENNIDLDNIVNIRINNCFVNAQKQYLEKIKKEIINLNNSLNIPGKIKTILIDSTVVAASDKNLILTCGNIHNVENSNRMLAEIEQVINKELNENYKIIFLSEKRWQEEKEKYIVNVKNKYVYNYINEDEQIMNNIDINDVFNKSKVEIV